MIGVAQDDLGVKIVNQIARQQALDGGLRPHRHEDGGLDIAMGGMQDARARAGSGTGCLDFKTEH
jgi:hypothetical protein